jgi:hypothetical protein
LGTDEAAVIATVGREPDDSFGRLDKSGRLTGCVLFWSDGEACLLVDFGLDGKAEATEFMPGNPTLWERVRDWWPW